MNSKELILHAGEKLIRYSIAVLAMLALSQCANDSPEPISDLYTEYEFTGKVIEEDSTIATQEFKVRSLQCKGGTLYFGEASVVGEKMGKIKDYPKCHGDRLDLSGIKNS